MRIHRQAILAALITGAFSAAQFAPTHAAGAVTLRYNYKVGQQFTEVLTQHSTTKLSASLVNGKTTIPFTQSSVETDKATVTVKVISVAANGSALVRISFLTASVTKDGKTTSAATKGYYRDETIRPDGTLAGTKTVGEATVPKALLDSLPNTDPTVYPTQPVSVGGTWQINDKSVTGFGPQGVLKHYTLLALGTQGGVRTATTRAIIDMPVRFAQSGLFFSGHAAGTQNSQFVIDTGADISNHATASFTGKLSGSSQGFVAKGTFAISFDQTAAPM